MFGQTKRTGDVSFFVLLNLKLPITFQQANMYPKPVQDLAGWNISHVGTSYTSIVVSADETCIAWGASPTYGELGLGDMQKSSTVPKEVLF